MPDTFKKFLQKKDDEKRREKHFVWEDGDLVKVPQTTPEPSPEKPKPLGEDFSGRPFDTPVERTVDHSYGHHVHNVEDERKDFAQINPHLNYYKQKYNTMEYRHQHALREYKIDSEQTNRPLRDLDNHHSEGHIILHPKAMTEVGDLDRVTDHPITHPLTVWRGFRPVHVEQMKAGEVWQDHGYTGTSLHMHIAGRFSGYDAVRGNGRFLARIHIPTGSKGLYFNAHREVPCHSESEFVLHRGTQFQVLGHERINFAPPPLVRALDEEHIPFAHIAHLRVIGHDTKPVKRDPIFD